VVASGENSSTFCVLIQEVNCTCFSQYKCPGLLDIGFRWPELSYFVPVFSHFVSVQHPTASLGVVSVLRSRIAVSAHSLAHIGQGQGFSKQKAKAGRRPYAQAGFANLRPTNTGCKPVASRTCPTRMICFENPNPPSLVPSCLLCYTIADLMSWARAQVAWRYISSVPTL
jgi:hypothetical protein